MLKCKIILTIIIIEKKILSNFQQISKNTKICDSVEKSRISEIEEPQVNK